MHPKYPNVFSPIRLGPVELPTRFFFAPHGSPLSIGTRPSDDLAAYSAARVEGGGCGLVVLALVLHERGRTRQPSPHLAENVPAFRAFADAIHAAGGKVFGQTFYHWTGAGQWQTLSTPGPAFSPSVRQFGFGGRASSTHALGKAEIAGILEALRQSAANLRGAGFDGIMLHASHAALLEQFLSPYFNQRDDEYGGSLENRMRFMVEALQAARAGAGPDMAVGMRFNCDEQIAGGYDSDEASEVVARLGAQGLLDYIDLDVGLEPQQFHHGMPNGFEAKQYYRPFVAKVRKAATVPVLSVLGSVTRMADAEAAIAAGVIDVAGAARQLIAEPEFVQNARSGREDLSRACIGCNWCTASLGDGAVGCTINPASYRERIWGPGSFTPAARPSRVVVVGGGPGGMEAARVAALKGHAVTLHEARGELGGALALWGALPGREHYGGAIGWWRAELERLGVDVRLGSTADVEMVLGQNPDAVIVATGARTHPGGRSITHDADIPGSDRAHVRSVEDLLLSGERPGGRVFVFDAEGYHGGAGTAEMLAAGGAEVHLVFAGHSPVSPRNTDNWEERYIVGRMKERGVHLHPSTWLRAIGADAVTLCDVHTLRETIMPADAVVLATGRAPVDGLARALDGKVPQLFTIGDALAARMFAAATFEGQKFARLIGEPGAPATVSETWFAPDPAETMMLPADVPRPVA